MKQTINNLETRVKEVESKLNSIDFKSVLKLPKDAQKSSLRLKMAMKANLVKLLDKNVNLELEMTTLLQKINDSNFNSAYFSVLEASAKTLSKLNSQLKIDDVDRVKADIDEEIMKEEEIGDALAGEAEDVDVDEELNKMLDEEEKAKEEAAKEENVKEEKAKNDNAEEEAKQQNADKEKERELLSRLENLTVDDVIKQSPQHDSPATIVPFEQSH